MYGEAVSEDEKDGVRNVCEKIIKNNVMRGNFKQVKEIKSLSRSFTGHGVFVISQDDGIVWNVVKPFPSIMIVTDNEIIQLSASGKSSVIESDGNPIFKQFANTFRTVFSGNAESLFSLFEVYFDSHSENIWQIGLVPKDSIIHSVISSIELSGNESLDRFVMTESTGDTLLYEFSDQTFSMELNDAEKKYFNR